MVMQITDRAINAIGKRVLLYRPLPAARAFHASTAKYRWFFGGNRSGKSEANIGYDLCAFALGVHRVRRTPRRAVIWAIAPTWEMVGTILWAEKIKSYLPAGQIASIAWHEKAKDVPAVLYLRNGTRIEFKAFEQGRIAFQGRALDAIYADEQCPHDGEAIWNELQMRVIDPSAEADCERFIAWSCTPIVPQAWLELRDSDPGPQDAAFHANLNDNRLSRGGYIADAEIEALIAQWPEEVRATRIEGRFASYVGAVYGSFRRDIHVRKVELPADCERYRAIDLGFNNPFVCLWGARYGPDRRWHIYREYYRPRDFLATHARQVQALSGAERYIATWADHDAQDVYELADKGLATLPAKKDVRLGIELVQAKLKVQPDGRPQLTIDPGCVHLIRELIAYHWREGTELRDPRDEPQKKDDHGPDAARYLLYSVEGDSYFQR